MPRLASSDTTGASARKWSTRFRSELKGPRPGGPHQRRPDGRIFRPGAPISQSGIYEILHERDHRTSHEAVMIAGDSFPECDTCRDRVRFKLVSHGTLYLPGRRLRRIRIADRPLHTTKVIPTDAEPPA